MARTATCLRAFAFLGDARRLWGQARVQVYDYAKPKPATWPEADFIVGNPPFIGASRLRDALGDGYAEALWAAHPKMPQSADFVMFWWEKAALAARGWKPASDKAKAKGARRFGFITTNSLRQTFNRKVLDAHLTADKLPLLPVFAIPDHPWVDAGDGAAVRIAMTVAEVGKATGRVLTIAEEKKGETESEGRPVTFLIEKGKVFADLRIGADVAGAMPLRANEGVAHTGVKTHGIGFIVSAAEAKHLGLGSVAELDQHIRPFLNGRDLAQMSREAMVIDLFGLSEASVRERFPVVFQHLLDRVRPERDAKASASPDSAQYAKLWWLHGKPRPQMRPALAGLSRYIATPRTAKFRIFQFVPAVTLAESKLVVLATDDAWQLAVVSSRPHELFSLAAGGWLGVGNDPTYNHSACFNPFPFPDPTDAQKARLRSLGEQLDAHRKAQQAAHPKLTLTGMYNVLEKLRAGRRIEGRDRETYDQGLIGILRDLHDQIDREVAAAYGWPDTLTDDEILHRLVDLNRTRAAEEARGLVRWLRPGYQNPAGRAVEARDRQSAMDIGPTETTAKTPWPKTMPDQIAAVRAALHDMGEATPDQIARRFHRVQSRSVQPLLEILTALGHARPTEAGRFAS